MSDTRPATRHRNSPARYGDKLNERQRQILPLIAVGMSHAEIGATLYLSRETVKTHVCRMLVKLGAANRAHAVHIAHQRGWLS